MSPSLPDTMTCIAIPSPGGPEALVPQSRPLPVPGPGELLLRVEAAGVNRPDVLQRKGAYPPPPGAPDVPGLEVAGIVAACGPGAARFAPGERVMGLLPGGGYAQFAVVHETNALPVPEGLSPTEAGAIPETYFTVWTNVFERGRLSRGETSLVHGGTSGIGTTAIQLAKAFGARVVTTAGSPEKCEACRRLGADLAIDYRAQDFVAEVKSFTDKRGVDLVLDMVGGSYIQRNIDVCATEGRIVQIGFQDSPTATVDFRRLMLKRLTFTGSTLRIRTVPEKAAIAAALEAQVWPLLARGQVRPLIHATFPLVEAWRAHALMESSAHIGKIVLVP